MHFIKLKLMRIILIFVLLTICTCTNPALSQNRQATLTGVLTDSIEQSPVRFATVSIYKEADTSLVTYRLSDDKGMFRIPDVPPAVRLLVIITSVGYQIERMTLTVESSVRELDLGEIALQASDILLEEVLVLAELPPVSVRKDTIEFNAAAFKTLPNALVEDLLRKLPGVSVDRNGNITVNGRNVSKIYVDSKDFF